MKTFFKICPEKLIYTHSAMDGITVLVNGSFIYWMHLDDVDEQDARGLEINSVLIDQGEEIGENIYLVMDARVGRWDKAQVPLWLQVSQLSGDDFEIYQKLKVDDPQQVESFVKQNTKWPRHKKWGHLLVPNYMDVLCNPADDDEFHWTYRFYHPDSLERKPDHFSIERATDDELNDAGTIQQMLNRDEEWVNKYYYGKVGSPKAQIHKMDAMSIIDPDEYYKTKEGTELFEQFLKTLKLKAALFRILDHGDTGVTACGWAAVMNHCNIFYREYYINATLISVNRQNIADLSFDESYMGDFADPDIFRKYTQKINGSQAGFWAVADEYQDTEAVTAPPIFWQPADNNEFATRNRINELLIPQQRYFHPITKISPAPAIYFIKRSEKYPLGCHEMILQMKSQRKELLGNINGRNIYSDNRDTKIVDHAYDLVRYHIAMHNTNKTEIKRKPPRRSFAYYQEVAKRRPTFREGSFA